MITRDVTRERETPAHKAHRDSDPPYRGELRFSGHATRTPSRGCSPAGWPVPFRASLPPARLGRVLRSAPRLTAAPTGPTAVDGSSHRARLMAALSSR